jgi:hypothetical protein
MNIFILDNNIELCAQYHNDKHVIKMILETTQLLNNARIKYDPNASHIYRETHKNHPCSIWAATSSANFNWLTKLGLALCSEYTFRYGKIHKCQKIIQWFSISSSFVPEGELTPFVQCMPDQYKSNDAVAAYRAYYIGEKKDMAKWKGREVPEWWIQ